MSMQEQELQHRYEMLQVYHSFLLERGSSMTVPAFEDFKVLSVADQQRLVRDLRDLVRTPSSH